MLQELLHVHRNKTACYISLTNTFSKYKMKILIGKWILCHHLIRSIFVLEILKIVMYLKSIVLESMKYSINDCILSALDNSKNKNSLLMLLFSNLFFSNLFFLSQMDIIYRWTSISLLEKQCCWLKSLWVDQISSLLTAPEWSLPIPQSASLANQTFFHVCTSCCSRPQLPLSLADFLEKATEESWAEGGFCMLVKKNNLCQRKVLQQLCCKTCTFQGWAAILDFFVSVDL